MRKEHFNLLLDQLELQCDFADYSFSKFNELYRELPHTKALIHPGNKIWFFLRGFTTASANIAKLLVLPTEDESNYNERAKEELRSKRIARKLLIEKLNVNDQLPIIASKKLRNSLEHIDERIDNYDKPGVKLDFNRSVAPNFLRKMKGSVQLGNQVTTFDKTDYKENLFYENNTLYYAAFGSDTPLYEAHQELLNLKKKVEELRLQFNNGDFDTEFSY
ncbi:hypothetical protein DN444_01510 [Lactobacillus reuteri]|uniref:hypothetical protein n=1 Tax=Limosilactobacillus reuteri TaxID=1598 RepID=UPI00128E19D9|nr:hypothetical protein [Limosilactobacillus reuteri]MQB88628.1 hypothetical protein [Limosilactobacillus reuteri]